jgi:hypothetical protein
LILLDDLQLQTSICEPGWLATFVEFIGVAVVGAKNEALFPGRVPHVRPSVHGLKTTGRSPISANLRSVAVVLFCALILGGRVRSLAIWSMCFAS